MKRLMIIIMILTLCFSSTGPGFALRPMPEANSFAKGHIVNIRELFREYPELKSKNIVVYIDNNVPEEIILKITPWSFVILVGELMHNIRKHAFKKGNIYIRMQESQLIIEVIDHGRGIDYDSLGVNLSEAVFSANAIRRKDGVICIIKDEEAVEDEMSKGAMLLTIEEAAEIIKRKKKELPFILGLSLANSHGLGLYEVKRYVDEAGGVMSCATSEDGTIFTIHLPADETVKDKLLSKTAYTSNYHYSAFDQLESVPRPEPLMALRGHLEVRDGGFILNGSPVEWAKIRTPGIYSYEYINFRDIMSHLAKEEDVKDFKDSIGNPFLYKLIMDTGSDAISEMDEIFYNVLYSYLSQEQLDVCVSAYEYGLSRFFECFFELLYKCDIDIDIIFEYYPKTNSYNDEVQIKIVNNKPLRLKDRKRIQKAIGIMEKTTSFAERSRLLKASGIVTKNSGRGFQNFIGFLDDGAVVENGVYALYEFKEYSNRTEQVIRLINMGCPFFLAEFIVGLRAMKESKRAVAGSLFVRVIESAA